MSEILEMWVRKRVRYAIAIVTASSLGCVNEKERGES